MKWFIVVIVGSILISCTKPTEFSRESLQDVLIDLNGNKTSFASVLEKHQGTTIFIDFWASWCKDCIVGMPKVNKLHQQNRDISFIFLTVDHDVKKWQKGIKKFQLDYGDHYLIADGWKESVLCDFIDLDWIPRYVIVDPTGKISMFKASDAKDPDINAALKSRKQTP